MLPSKWEKNLKKKSVSDSIGKGNSSDNHQSDDKHSTKCSKEKFADVRTQSISDRGSHSSGKGESTENMSVDSDAVGIFTDESKNFETEKEAPKVGENEPNGQLPSDSNNNNASKQKKEEKNTLESDAESNGKKELAKENSSLLPGMNQELENNSWGNTTRAISENIKTSTEIGMNWDFIKELKNFKTSVSFSTRQLTRMRPNRRLGFDTMGSKIQPKPKILIAVDVSRSVKNSIVGQWWQTINQVINTNTKIKSVDVIQFDSDLLGKPEKIQKKFKQKPRLGRGGTNFQPVIDYAKKHSEYDGVIIFTDGEAKTPVLPSKMHTRILWVLYYQSQIQPWMEKACYINSD